MFLICFSSFLTFDVVTCELLYSNFVFFRYCFLRFSVFKACNNHMQTSKSDYFVKKVLFFFS